MILLSCANHSEKVSHPKSFQQITYILDTIADKYVYRELEMASDVSLDENGDIKAISQTRFSFEHPGGIADKGMELYSPESFWDAFYEVETDTLFKKYSEDVFTDTLIIHGDYTFQYNNNSQLTFMSTYEYQLHFDYDENGEWIQISQAFPDIRSDHVTYRITSRVIQYIDQTVEAINMTYLTSDGEDIFTRQNKTIADYYVLSRKAGIFNPDNGSGTFDLKNAYFEYQDEGTGGGVFTGQLRVFKDNNAKEILAINGYYDEAGTYFTTSGTTPEFYLLDNKMFTEVSDIFPQVNTQMFYDRETIDSTEGITTFFTLPQEGLTIGYNVSTGLGTFCNNLNSGSVSNPEDYQDICQRYSMLKRTTIGFEFDPVTGTFKITN